MLLQKLRKRKLPKYRMFELTYGDNEIVYHIEESRYYFHWEHETSDYTLEDAEQTVITLINQSRANVVVHRKKVKINETWIRLKQK